MVVDERGVFREDNFQKAVAAVHDAAADGGSKGKGKSGPSSNNNQEGAGEKTDIFKIVKMILERNYDPVIVFSFSKKECEKLALSMVTLDLTDKDEKLLVTSIFKSAVECLSLVSNLLYYHYHEHGNVFYLRASITPECIGFYFSPPKICCHASLFLC